MTDQSGATAEDFTSHLSDFLSVAAADAETLLGSASNLPLGSDPDDYALQVSSQLKNDAKMLFDQMINIKNTMDCIPSCEMLIHLCQMALREVDDQILEVEENLEKRGIKVNENLCIPAPTSRELENKENDVLNYSNQKSFEISLSSSKRKLLKESRHKSVEQRSPKTPTLDDFGISSVALQAINEKYSDSEKKLQQDLKTIPMIRSKKATPPTQNEQNVITSQKEILNQSSKNVTQKEYQSLPGIIRDSVSLEDFQETWAKLQALGTSWVAETDIESLDIDARNLKAIVLGLTFMEKLKTDYENSTYGYRIRT